MEKKIYEVKKEGIREINSRDLPKESKEESILYMIDIKIKNREEASGELLKLGLAVELSEHVLNPSEHLRFEYINDILYGEIAYFSGKTKKLDYAGIVIQNKTLIIIHTIDEGLIANLRESFSSFTEKQKNKITNVRFMLFLVIHEILSYHSKLILSYREKIDKLADKLDDDQPEIQPENFLEYRTQISHLAIAVEKQIYTLSLQPLENVLDLDNPYRPYFDDLLKGLSLFKVSLEHTEDRLNALNDHFQLQMQGKMNKRLNFLTVMQSIFVPLTLIAGIYGMNFKYMPELDFRYGYFITIGAMIVTSIFFIIYFYRHGWFD